MSALDAPLLSRGELMELDTDRLVEKILGLRNDLADDAEEIASLRQELDALAAALRTERAAREAAEAHHAALAGAVRAYLAAQGDGERITEATWARIDAARTALDAALAAAEGTR